MRVRSIINQLIFLHLIKFNLLHCKQLSAPFLNNPCENKIILAFNHIRKRIINHVSVSKKKKTKKINFKPNFYFISVFRTSLRIRLLTILLVNSDKTIPKYSSSKPKRSLKILVISKTPTTRFLSFLRGSNNAESTFSTILSFRVW